MFLNRPKAYAMGPTCPTPRSQKKKLPDNLIVHFTNKKKLKKSVKGLPKTIRDGILIFLSYLTPALLYLHTCYCKQVECIRHILLAADSNKI